MNPSKITVCLFSKELMAYKDLRSGNKDSPRFLFLFSDHCFRNFINKYIFKLHNIIITPCPLPSLYERPKINIQANFLILFYISMSIHVKLCNQFWDPHHSNNLIFPPWIFLQTLQRQSILLSGLLLHILILQQDVRSCRKPKKCDDNSTGFWSLRPFASYSTNIGADRLGGKLKCIRLSKISCS